MMKLVLLSIISTLILTAGILVHAGDRPTLSFVVAQFSSGNLSTQNYSASLKQGESMTIPLENDYQLNVKRKNTADLAYKTELVRLVGNSEEILHTANQSDLEDSRVNLYVLCNGKLKTWQSPYVEIPKSCDY